MVHLELLPKGTIKRLFTVHPKRVSTLLTHPLCVHYEFVYDETGEFVVEIKRCHYKAERGFLCRMHDGLLLSKKTSGCERDYKGEAVDTVIKGEARALKDAKREVIGLKYRINFLDGVRMKSDPEVIIKAVAKDEGVSLSVFDIPIFPEEPKEKKKKSPALTF